MNKRIRKKRCKQRFPPLDPSEKLDWKDKHIFAFAAKNNYEAAYFFERLVDHTVASEGATRDDAIMLELTRLRTVAQSRLGDPQVDEIAIMGFVYTRYIRPMAKKYDIKIGHSDHDLHAPQKRIIELDRAIARP